MCQNAELEMCDQKQSESVASKFNFRISKHIHLNMYQYWLIPHIPCRHVTYAYTIEGNKLYMECQYNLWKITQITIEPWFREFYGCYMIPSPCHLFPVSPRYCNLGSDSIENSFHPCLLPGQDHFMAGFGKKQNKGNQNKHSFSIPSRGLTYPTLGKGKSSSKCHFWGDMLIPWRVKSECL